MMMLKMTSRRMKIGVKARVLKRSKTAINYSMIQFGSQKMNLAKNVSTEKKKSPLLSPCLTFLSLEFLKFCYSHIVLFRK